MMTTTLLSRLRSTAVAAVCLSLAAATSMIAKAQQAPVAQPIIMADFNHDGIPDALVMSTTAPTATIALGTVPYGTFSATSKVVTFPAACTSLPQGPVLAGDFNGDGLADIAFFCGREATGVMLGNGDGTFGKPTLISGIISSIAALGDFNKDGKLDIVAIGSNGSDDAFPSIIFFAGNGDGTFAQGVTTAYTSTAVYTALAIADVNGDGYPDVVAANFTPTQTPTIDVFGNNKDGTFGVPGDSASGPNTSVGLDVPAATSILTGSFFGPGTVDFVIPVTGTNPGLFAIHNTSSTGAYSLASPVTIASPGLLSAMAGSFTGGTTTDLIVANGTNISVLANDGTGNFAATYSTLTLPSATSLFAVADANGDGYTDVYTANLNANALQLGVNLVTGSATATAQPVQLGIGSKTITAAWAGNANLNGSTATGQEIVLGAQTVVALTSSKNPSLLGDAVTFTATVAPATPTTTAPPTGMVAISDGTNMLATGAIDATGTFSYTTSALTQATHLIQATYTGDGNFATSSSTVLSQIVGHAGAVVSILTWATPAPIIQGTALSSAQLNATAADANGNAIPGTFIYTPAAGTVPNAGTVTLSVTFTPTDLASFLPATQTVLLTVTSSGLAATVTAPPTTAPGSQATVTVMLTQPYPVDLVGTLTIGFTRVTSPQITDPSLQFAAGGTTVTFPIPANTTTVPPIELQAGTIAGTITVPLTLTAGGINVTPAGLAPVTIVVPPAVPSVSGMTLTRNGSQFTVILHGFSNTREVSSAQFHFTPAAGSTIETTDLTLSGQTTFDVQWFDTDPSDAYGSTFTYTQIFNISDDATVVGSVDATLTNSVGTSTTMTAK